MRYRHNNKNTYLKSRFSSFMVRLWNFKNRGYRRKILGRLSVPNYWDSIYWHFFGPVFWEIF